MNIKEIENIYAQNSKTPAFLVLVNHYYNNKLYSHAQKICEEGLKIHPHNLDAHYINAKLILLYGEVKKAEKILKYIVKKEICNVKPFILLFKVMESLKRSENSIANYVLIANKIFYFHPSVQQYYSKYINIKNRPKKPKKKASVIKKKQVLSSKKDITINNDFNIQFATKTMYKLYLSQKKYIEAKSILLLMKNNKEHIKFVYDELVKIKQLIDKEKNEF